MSGQVNLTGYKLQSQNKGADFYSIYGSMTHGVSGYGSNAVSVGYYATSMSLVVDLDGHPPNSQVWDAGPTSTVGQSTTGFNIGGSLSGGVFAGAPILSAGMTGSFGASYSSPDVTIANSRVGEMITWNVTLPGVGYQSPGVPANPLAPSYSGYTWYFGAIYVVPPGQPFVLRVNPSITWHFDYTRGITYDTKTWNVGDSQDKYTFVPAPASSTPATSTS